MRTFDVTLNGFDGGTDKTDHLVKWVLAKDLKTVNDWIDQLGLRPFVRDVQDLGDHAKNYTFADGVDVMLDTVGEPERGDVEYLPGLWQVTVVNFKPQDWMDQEQIA